MDTLHKCTEEMETRINYTIPNKTFPINHPSQCYNPIIFLTLGPKLIIPKGIE